MLIHLYARKLQGLWPYFDHCLNSVHPAHAWRPTPYPDKSSQLEQHLNSAEYIKIRVPRFKIIGQVLLPNIRHGITPYEFSISVPYQTCK